MSNNFSISNISFDAYKNDAYGIVLHLNGLLSFMVGGFGTYITWFWTPQDFGKYKYFLFNISLWALLFDTYMTFCYTPWPLFPAIVNCPVGLLKTTNPVLARTWFNIALFLFSGTTMAVLSAFIYRFAVLKGKLSTILGAKFLTFLAFLHITYEIPAGIFIHLCALNNTAVEEAIVKVDFLFSQLFDRMISALPKYNQIFPK